MTWLLALAWTALVLPVVVSGALFQTSVFDKIGGPYVFTAPTTLPLNRLQVRMWGGGGGGCQLSVGGAGAFVAVDFTNINPGEDVRLLSRNYLQPELMRVFFVLHSSMWYCLSCVHFLCGLLL